MSEKVMIVDKVIRREAGTVLCGKLLRNVWCYDSVEIHCNGKVFKDMILPWNKLEQPYQSKAEPCQLLFTHLNPNDIKPGAEIYICEP